MILGGYLAILSLLNDDHIDKKELRESYLAHIPQLGI
jgi:hypothetical protein